MPGGSAPPEEELPNLGHVEVIRGLPVQHTASARAARRTLKATSQGRDPAALVQKPLQPPPVEVDDDLAVHERGGSPRVAWFGTPRIVDSSPATSRSAEGTPSWQRDSLAMLQKPRPAACECAATLSATWRPPCGSTDHVLAAISWPNGNDCVIPRFRPPRRAEASTPIPRQLQGRRRERPLIFSAHQGYAGSRCEARRCPA